MEPAGSGAHEKYAFLEFVTTAVVLGEFDELLQG
jgi:hypothetical protein